MPSALWWEGFDAEGRPAFMDPFPVGERRVFLLPVPPIAAIEQPFTVRAMVVDDIGNPVSGVTVTLSISGSAHYVSGPVATDGAGYAEFTVTPLEHGALILQASADGVDSEPMTISVPAPFSGGASYRRKPRRPEARVSYMDIDAPPAGAAPAPLAPSMALATPVPHGRADVAPQLAQAVAAIAADQQQKLEAEMAAMQRRLT